MPSRWVLSLTPLTAIMLLAADAPPKIYPEAIAIPPAVLTWSSHFMNKTPAGDVTFHGPFGKETLTVTTAELPKHEVLDITLRLLILRTWDGSPDWPITHKDQPGDAELI